MHEDPTENRLGELGSLYKYYLLIILIIIILKTNTQGLSLRNGSKSAW